MANDVSVAMILHTVSATFDVPLELIKSTRQRPPRAIAARFAACLLARDLTRQSYPQIGRMIGDRDHTTILNAVRRADALCASDPEFAEKVAAARMAVEALAASKLASKLRDFDAVALALLIVSAPYREGVAAPALGVAAIADRMLILEDMAGGVCTLLARLAAAPADMTAAEFLQHSAALVEAVIETLASLGHGDAAKPEIQPKETTHV